MSYYWLITKQPEPQLLFSNYNNFRMMLLNSGVFSSTFFILIIPSVHNEQLLFLITKLEMKI